MNETHQDSLWNKRYEMLYRCQLSIKYHDKRASFYYWRDAACNGVTCVLCLLVILAVQTLFPKQFVQTSDGFLVAQLVAVLAIVPFLVRNYAADAHAHERLAMKFKSILRDIEGQETGLTEAVVGSWQARVLNAEVGEPPARSYLVRMCQNELAVEARQPWLAVPVPWHRRLLAHWL